MSIFSLIGSGVGAVMTGGVSLLANAKNYVIAGLVTVSIGAGGLALYRGYEVTNLTSKVVSLNADLSAAQELAQRQTDALAAVTKRMTASSARHQNIAKIQEAIGNATTSDDGSVAPVLRNALSGIGGLHANSANKNGSVRAP